jgi:malonyl-CoA O-methyltransferase
MQSSVPRLSHPRKKAIKKEFGKNPEYYHQYARSQRESAERLIESLKPWTAIIPKGPILEAGCGTGFLSRQLPDLFGNRSIEITDLAPEMVDYCRRALESRSEGNRLRFEVRDAEYLSDVEKPYGLIVHNFVAQWFQDPAMSMERMIECLKPGGLMLAAFPGNDSFPEWKKAAEEAGVAYSGNELPDTEEVVIKLSNLPVMVDYYEDTIIQRFESPRAFFRHLKKIGASTMEREEASIGAAGLKKLMSQWEQNKSGEITVQYHVIFLAVKKD